MIGFDRLEVALCASDESAAFAVRSLNDPDVEKIELVCPTDDTHRIWFPIGLLDVEPAPWCLCVTMDSTGARDNRMRPKNSPDRREAP